MDDKMVYIKKLTNKLLPLIGLLYLSAPHIALADEVTIWGEYHPPLNGNADDAEQVL